MTGKTIGSRYFIEQFIAEGGMSVVYLALDKKTAKHVALKLQKPDFRGKPEYVKIFKNEAKTALRLRQKNIVHSYDSGVDAENGCYIAMEYIDGCDLKEYINQKGALDPEEAVGIAKQLCLGLAYAHNRGIVHKDLKPQNVLLNSEHVPFISDFGIAFDEEEKPESEVMGSVHYFSPEQARGEEVDKRSDMYSLGIMLYEMVTGELPYKGEDKITIALMHMHQPPVAPCELCKDLPESLNRIILRAMAKEPAQRYQSAMELYRDLSRVFTDADGKYVLLADDNAKVDEPKQHVRIRMRKVAILLACCVVIIASLVIVLTSVIGGTEKPAKLYMPLLTDMTIDDALSELKKLEVTVTVDYEYDVQRENGFVIRQTPEQGSVLQPNDEVKLVVSQNDVVALMPSLVGLSKEAALASLAEYGVDAPKIIEGSDADSPDGVVLTQSPVAGEPMGDEPVSITVNVLNYEEKIKTPDIVDKAIEEGVYDAAIAGFTSIFVEETKEGRKGRITSQSPDSGTRADADEGMYITSGRRGEPQFIGMFYMDDVMWFAQTEVMICMESDFVDIPVNLVLFKETFDSDDEFYEKYGSSIDISAYIDENVTSTTKNMSFYINGVKAFTKSVTLGRSK